jgi:hypothetical protein
MMDGAVLLLISANAEVKRSEWLATLAPTRLADCLGPGDRRVCLTKRVHRIAQSAHWWGVSMSREILWMYCLIW